MPSILPSGEELKVSPDEILRYLNPDGLRQLLRQSRLHWNLKVNKDADYYDNEHLWKYASEVHNEGLYQRMEIRTFPDNNAYPGYAGLNIDSGLFGLLHDLDKWDYAISEESKTNNLANRVQIGAHAKIPNKLGYGLDDNENMNKKTENRHAEILLDPLDGRGYIFTNDSPFYVNNEHRAQEEKLPLRTIARIGDIPTRITDLKNDLDFVADPDYHHTDNNFTDSNRYVVDNLDDRTFVFPELSKDKSGDYIENRRIGLNGEMGYNFGDGTNPYHSQPDLKEGEDPHIHGDRYGEALQSYNKNSTFSGNIHTEGFFPGVFRSFEELDRVDIVDQLRDPMTHGNTPGARRPYNYYLFDGKWSPNWFDRYQYKDSYLAQSMNPGNMEIIIEGSEPVPFSRLNQVNTPWNATKLYQWRYNRVTLKYFSKDIRIDIVEPGEDYKVGDILRWTFADDVFLYKVLQVGGSGQIQAGEYQNVRERIFEQDPSTHGVGLPFTNMSGVGHNAKLALLCKVTIETTATQIKNNLYAYVDVVPTVRSDNTTPWSDTSIPNDSNGSVVVRSTAPAPAFSGINKGRGGPDNPLNAKKVFYEHGGNATAGSQIHLFRYVINTQNPTWVIRDDIQVFTGAWVDQGPLGVERPCDIKALFLSNPDTNNFNNYYKFLLDSMLDVQNAHPDEVTTNSKNTVSQAYLHVAQNDPEYDQRFKESRYDPETNTVKDIDITDRVLYVNAATGVIFLFNSTIKNDPKYGYGYKGIGWFAFAGATAGGLSIDSHYFNPLP